MSNSKIIRAPVSFTYEDYVHCINCIDIVEYLLSPTTDGESLCISLDDIDFLALLLYRSSNIMRDVISSSEGPNYVI